MTQYSIVNYVLCFWYGINYIIYIVLKKVIFYYYYSENESGWQLFKKMLVEL